MTKVPVAGSVKTRLQPFLSEKDSAGIAEAFIRDTESRVNRLECEAVFCFSPNELGHELGRLLIHESTLVPQTGDTLGERMANAFAEVLGCETSPTLMIGTDCAMLSELHLEKAFSVLEKGCEAVVGPTDDGGFYLIGLRRSRPLVFENVDWSTSETLVQTLGNFDRLGIPFEKIEKLYDIDVENDLRRLVAEPALHAETSVETVKWLNAHDYLFKTES